MQKNSTRYCYDGDQIIAHYNSTGITLLRKFVYGPGIDEPICMIVPAAGTTYYYHFDGLGSVAALSNVDGEIVEKYRYDAFGNTTILSPSGQKRTQSAYSNPYMFTGREYDKETGNYYYRARYYKPQIGRFLQPDPIGFEDSLNLYTYIKNNPIVNVDPQGLCGSYSYSSNIKVTSVRLVGQWFLGLGCEGIKAGGGADKVKNSVESTLNTSRSRKSECPCGNCLILYSYSSITPVFSALGVPLTATGDIATNGKPACIAYITVVGIISIDSKIGICSNS